MRAHRTKCRRSNSAPTRAERWRLNRYLSYCAGSTSEQHIQTERSCSGDRTADGAHITSDQTRSDQIRSANRVAERRSRPEKVEWWRQELLEDVEKDRVEAQRGTAQDSAASSGRPLDETRLHNGVECCEKASALSDVTRDNLETSGKTLLKTTIALILVATGESSGPRGDSVRRRVAFYRSRAFRAFVCADTQTIQFRMNRGVAKWLAPTRQYEYNPSNCRHHFLIKRENKLIVAPNEVST